MIPTGLTGRRNTRRKKQTKQHRAILPKVAYTRHQNVVPSQNKNHGEGRDPTKIEQIWKFSTRVDMFVSSSPGPAENPTSHTLVRTCITSFSKVLCMKENHEACRGQDASSVAEETDDSSRSAGTSGFLCKPGEQAEKKKNTNKKTSKKTRKRPLQLKTRVFFPAVSTQHTWRKTENGRKPPSFRRSSLRDVAACELKKHNNQQHAHFFRLGRTNNATI